MSAVALEERMVAYLNEQVAVAGRAAVWARLAFAGQSHLCAGIDSGRDIDFVGYFFRHIGSTAAIGASVSNHLTLSMT